MTTTMQDGAEYLTGGAAPPTTEPTAAQPVPVSPGPGLPPGVHPRDASVPLVPGQHPDQSPIQNEGTLPAQGRRRQAPWSVENEDAFAVNQRSAHDWTANTYTVSSNNPIQLAGRLRGCVSTLVWVPSTAAQGVMISPTEGDLTQGAGVSLSPGDSIELPTEGAVWCGTLVGQTTGTVYVVRFYNPPGGGLGLSST